MNRRSFLAMIGLAPVMPLAAEAMPTDTRYAYSLITDALDENAAAAGSPLDYAGDLGRAAWESLERTRKPYLRMDPEWWLEKLPASECRDWIVDGDLVILDTQELIFAAESGHRIIRCSDGELYTNRRARALGLLPQTTRADQDSNLHPHCSQDSSQNAWRGGPA